MKSEEYLDLLLSLPDMEDYLPKVSPDGKWISWAWFKIGPASDVFCVPSDGSSAPLRLTQTPENTSLLSWTPDSKAVIVAQDQAGDERYRLFKVDLDQPLELRPLTEAAPEYFIQGGQLHPNGKWLVYTANTDVETGRELEASWLYRHDLVSGVRVPLAQPSKAMETEPKLNLTGTHILYGRKDLHPAGVQTWLIDIDGKDDREILNFGPDVKTFADWLPDSRRALVQVETPTHRKIGIWSLDTGTINWLLDDPSRDIINAYVPNGSQWAVIVQFQQGKVSCSLIDLDSGAEIILPKIPGNLIPLAPAFPFHTAENPGKLDIERDIWLGFYYSSRQPTDVVRFPLADPRPENLLSLTDIWGLTRLSPGDFVQAEDYLWGSADGLKIHGWLYRTRGQARGTIIYIHGGPTWHSEDWINPKIQYYTALDFNVLDINYRGSTGYGLPFREAIREDGWGGREQEDIRAGIESLITEGIAQKGKIGITGTSYGGYSSWWAITRFPLDLMAASSPICGMTDLVVDYETTRPDMRPYSEEMMGGRPDQVPDRYFQRSPINFVDRIRGKLLIVQGERDPNVTPKNVSDVIKKLDAAGIPFELLTFDDEGHGVSKTPNQRTLLVRQGKFFEEAFNQG